MTILSPITEVGCGCGTLEDQTSLLTIDEALAQIVRGVRPITQIEFVELAHARGRMLAKPVCACTAVPPFDNSAMDGYAISAESLTGAGPWHLAVTARIAAGQAEPASVTFGTAAQIFTGAPIPEGADAVVMQEDVQRFDGMIVVSKKVKPGTHIRIAGEDMGAGETIVPAGRQLTARDIGACAAAGSETVCVRRRVRVALLVTGDEVRKPGFSGNRAGIWDVNTSMLSAAISSNGVELVNVEIGQDDRKALRTQISRLAENADLVVTTGGISVGEEDHLRPALVDLGATIVFSGVAMKPGKPISFGRVKQAYWLGLPGNPLSAFITWHLFGTVLGRVLAGGSPTSGIRRHVVLSHPLHHRPGRCELRLAELSGFDGAGREGVRFADATHSGRVARLPDADGVILIPADVETLPTGALVEFQPFCDR